MRKNSKQALDHTVDGLVDYLIYKVGLSKDKAMKEVVNALQEPGIKGRILYFVLLGNEITTAAGANCSGVKKSACQ
ncbi:MAG: hypothetical protein WCK32_00910 [Chlorobiaceae bacterium]